MCTFVTEKGELINVFQYWIRAVRGLQGWFTRLGVPAKASD
jgi:hypothetical protein